MAIDKVDPKKIGRVIALEEAFSNTFITDHYAKPMAQMLETMTGGRLREVGQERIALMDAAGIDFQVLSHQSPGVQTFDLQTAQSLATKSNDWIAENVSKYPKRFGAFAALPTQDGELAAKELELRVTRDRFLGGLINGHTNGKFLDDKSFWPIFETAQKLDVPIYLHPANAPEAILQTYYKDMPALAGPWGWAVDTATQTLRMMAAGVFDEYPKLKFIIGHMGELIPFHLLRISNALELMRKGMGEKSGLRMKKTVADYMHENVYITTSGVFQHAALTCAVQTLGIERILFSVDYPFEENEEAIRFLHTSPLSDSDRRKLAHENAERVLRI
jgi:predicted TIM-barrel fold metal-dependent hydrolase